MVALQKMQLQTNEGTHTTTTPMTDATATAHSHSSSSCRLYASASSSSSLWRSSVWLEHDDEDEHVMEENRAKRTWRNHASHDVPQTTDTRRTTTAVPHASLPSFRRRRLLHAPMSSSSRTSVDGLHSFSRVAETCSLVHAVL